MAAVYFSLIWLLGTSAIYLVIRALHSRQSSLMSAVSFHSMRLTFYSRETGLILAANQTLTDNSLYRVFTQRPIPSDLSSLSTAKLSETNLPYHRRKARSVTAKAAGGSRTRANGD